MHWSRVKTILIIMFLCVDILLLCASFILRDSDGKTDSETITNTIQILKENNITVDASIIPDKTPHLGTVETENLRADRDGFARLLLGDSFAVFKDGGYNSGEKRVTFENTRVIGTNLINNIEPFTSENIKKELASIGVHSAKVLSQTDDTVVLCQEFDGKPVFEVEITVTKSNVLSGYFFAGNSPESYRQNEASRLTPVCSVLINLIDIPEAIGETVTSIETGYTLGEANGNDTYLLTSVFPAYRITTATGKAFVFDAVSGDLMYVK